MTTQDVIYLLTWLQGWLRLETLFFILGPVWFCMMLAYLFSLTVVGIGFSLYVAGTIMFGTAVNIFIPAVSIETAAWGVGIALPLAVIADCHCVRVCVWDTYVHLRNYVSKKRNHKRELIVLYYRPSQMPQHF